MPRVRLLVPDATVLPQYLAALQTGWSGESDDDVALAQKMIERVESDPGRFLASVWNPEATGPPVRLSDGRDVPRLAHVRHWIYDGQYCGDLNLRWQPGTSELPPYCDGHVGYSVVPWKRRQGVATAALRCLSRVAPRFGLAWLDISMSTENVASRGVAEAAGAALLGEYVAVEQGGVRACRYRLACRGTLTPSS
jgi:predicted acetyltransferase